MKALRIFAAGLLAAASMGASALPVRTTVADNGFKRLSAVRPRVTTVDVTNDNPLPPTDVTARVRNNGSRCTVSWNAPGDVGESGGYVDPSKFTYYIFNAFASFYDPAIAVTRYKSHTFDYTALTEPDFMAYEVTVGIDETWYSLSAVSNIVVVGPSLHLPFAESFAAGKAQHMWALDPSTSYDVVSRTLTDDAVDGVASYDGDNGCLVVLPALGEFWGMMSLTLDLSAVTNPQLQLFCRGENAKVQVLVTTDGLEWTKAEAVDFGADSSAWRPICVDLSPWKGSNTVQFEVTVEGTSAEHSGMAILDDIRVVQVLGDDVALTRLQAPASVAAPGVAAISAAVENRGSSVADNVAVTLYRDGEEIQSVALGSLEPSTVTDVDFTDAVTLADDDEIVYRLVVTAAADSDESNNSLEVKVAALMPLHPGVDGLEASASSDGVHLSWVAPDYLPLTYPVAVVEDFEAPEYEDFCIDGPGDWTVVDGDALPTYSFFNDVLNPYRTRPMAWQLYNPKASGMPQDNLIDAQTADGERMLAAWSCQGHNHNWLISPALSGRPQTITFLAKSFTIGWPESFTAYCSTTDAAIGSFEPVACEPDPRSIPEDWTLFSIELPEGARYFAIEHDSDDTWALFVDDVEYEAPGVLPSATEFRGYNVYRDGLLLNPSPVDVCEYDDAEASAGMHSYRVSAVYDNAESRHSAPVVVSVDVDGLETLDADSDAEMYYNLQGIRVATPSTPGIYIRRTPSAATLHLSR